jgi:hypothetical protein
MSARRQHAGSESGSALLIAIFALLLISVIGIALLVSTGSDSALAGNYRNSMGAYYAAVAGLEEGRGRLLPHNPNFIGNTLPGFPPPPGTPFDVHTVVYVTNPANGETVNPTDPANAYYDKEYVAEFPGWGLSGTTVKPFVASVSPAPSASPALPGPWYKWVRINAVTEQSLNVDVDGGGINSDPTAMLYYNGIGLTTNNAMGTLALEVTALAAMPDKSTKLLQYVVGSYVISPNLPSAAAGPLGFPAGLTLLGNNVQYTGPGNGNFYIRGQDQCGGSNIMVPAIGFANSGDAVGSSTMANILSGATPGSNYQGAPVQSPGPPPTPSNQSVLDVTNSIQPTWLTPSGLDSVMQSVTNNADVVINGNATGTTISTDAPSMSASNPMTIVVNGDLDLNAWHSTGYGLLLVTGTLYYDPDASWEGLVLVIGQGNFVSTKHGTGGIDGAVVLAKTRDGAGNLLSSLGAASYSQTGGTNSGYGINYNSCWISGRYGAQGPLTYKVLSFREITQ